MCAFGLGKQETRYQRRPIFSKGEDFLLFVVVVALLDRHIPAGSRRFDTCRILVPDVFNNFLCEGIAAELLVGKTLIAPTRNEDHSAQRTILYPPNFTFSILWENRFYRRPIARPCLSTINTREGRNPAGGGRKLKFYCIAVSVEW